LTKFICSHLAAFKTGADKQRGNVIVMKKHMIIMMEKKNGRAACALTLRLADFANEISLDYDKQASM
jgi:hypothetical protein